MTSPNEETTTERIVYKVVVNDEEQYSIWPYETKVPLGWHEVDVSGSRDECLDYISETWTDIRPLSIRKRLK
jgi:MbtH protein